MSLAPVPTEDTENPFSDLKKGGRRESNNNPEFVGNILEQNLYSKGPPYHPPNLPRNTTNPVLYSGCTIILTIIMVFDIALLSLGIYHEAVAYSHDILWNKILQDQHPFPSLAGDSYFSGNHLSHLSPQLIPKFAISDIKMNLSRNQSYEIIFLCLTTFSIVSSIIHITLFVFWPKFRHKLSFTYLGYGILGILIFTAASFLLTSTMGQRTFIQARQTLEEGHVFKKNQTNDSKPEQDHHVNRYVLGHNHKTGHLEEHETCKIRPDYEEDQTVKILWTIVHICGYRYVSFNEKDVCKSVVLPDKVHILEKDYSVNELELLTICPMDYHKLIATFVIYLASICCFAVMWLGSHEEKSIFQPHVEKGQLVWCPHSVTAIEDWRMNMTTPSYLQIEMMMRPTGADLTVNDLTIDIEQVEVHRLNHPLGMYDRYYEIYRPGVYDRDRHEIIRRGSHEQRIDPIRVGSRERNNRRQSLSMTDVTFGRQASKVRTQQDSVGSVTRQPELTNFPAFNKASPSPSPSYYQMRRLSNPSGMDIHSPPQITPHGIGWTVASQNVNRIKNIMVIAPSMVIHPPAQKLTDRQEISYQDSHQQTSWFNE